MVTPTRHVSLKCLGVFVYQSGRRWAKGTQNETFGPATHWNTRLVCYGYHRIRSTVSVLFVIQWVRPLPPRAASRLSGLVRRLRCFALNSIFAECRADSDQGPGHTLKNDHTTWQPITNQSPRVRKSV